MRLTSWNGFGWSRAATLVVLLLGGGALWAMAQATDEEALVSAEAAVMDDALELEDLDLDDLVADLADEAPETDTDAATADEAAEETETPAVEDIAVSDELPEGAVIESPLVDGGADMGLDEFLADDLEVEAPAEDAQIADMGEAVVEVPEAAAADEMMAEESAAAESAGEAEPMLEPELADSAAPEMDGATEEAGIEDVDALVEAAIADAVLEGVSEPPALPPAEQEAVVVAAEPEAAPDLEALLTEDLAVEPEAMAVEPEVVAVAEPAMVEQEAEAVAEAEVAEVESDRGTPEEVPAEVAVGQPAAVPMAPVEVPAAPVETAEAQRQVAELDVLMKQEELRRQALEAHGRELLDQANKTAGVKDFKEAERLYAEALKLVGQREAARRTREAIRRGMADNYYAWALSLQRQGDREGARQMAVQARRIDHPRADELIAELDKPQEVTPAEVTEARLLQQRRDEAYESRNKRIDDLMREGREHYERAEYDKAQAKFEAVLQPNLDPQNTEAIRMVQKIAQRRYDRASMEVDATRRDMMTEVRKSWNPRDYGMAEAIGAAQITIRNEGVGPDQERIRIRQKLESIRIPEIDFRQANIHDVVDFLQRASVDFDVSDDPEDMKGVNIILNLGQSAQPAAAPSNDPFAAVMQTSAGVGSDIPLITFSARYLSLLEALKTVTSVANLKYRIEGSIVMIVPYNYPEGEIVVRMYNVLPDVEVKISQVGGEMQSRGDQQGDFISLDAQGPATQGGDMKAFFGDMGVPWPDGSSIKYVRAIGKMVVANTERNLATFERILEVLNVVPSQIEIEARFVEVTQTDLDSLGFEWMLTDNWELAQKAGQGNLPPAARQRLEVTANANSGGFTKGNRFIPTGLVGATAADDVLRIASVLTNPEMALVVHMLQQQGGGDVLSAPKVTTKSGTEASIKVVTEYIYPTEYDITPPTAGGGGTAGGSGQAVGPSVEPGVFETREVGVILQVLPEVTTDGQMINLNMTPQVVSEPIWYDYGYDVAIGGSEGSDATIYHVKLEQPFFRTRAIQTSISIYNGATVVMGGMITEARHSVDDKVPILGDIPLLGRLFRSRYEQSEKRNLLIFVTARLVDPSGVALKPKSQESLPEQMEPGAVPVPGV